MKGIILAGGGSEQAVEPVYDNLAGEPNWTCFSTPCKGRAQEARHHKSARIADLDGLNRSPRRGGAQEVRHHKPMISLAFLCNERVV